MSNKYKICIYIPGVSYTSVGPGFIDAIKLDAVNAQYPEIKYNVYTKHYTDLQNVSLIDTNPYIYRCVDPTVAINGGDGHPVSSVQYSAEEGKRSPYGYFYDFLQTENDGTFSHVLTCFSDTNKIENLESFDLNNKDGIFVVEVDEADALVELLFTFYMLSYDQYTETSSNLYKEPVTCSNNPDEYIVIGSMTKILRASTMQNDTEAEMVAANELEMYYDINQDPNSLVYLPIDGEDFVPVKGIEGGDIKVLKSGSDAFTAYSELSGPIQWPSPKTVKLNPSKLDFNTEAVATCGFAVADGIMKADGMGSNAYPWFSNATKVNVGTFNTLNKKEKVTFLISNIDSSATGAMWSRAPLYAILNVTHNSTLHDLDSTYAPMAIAEFTPDLTSIVLHNPEDINIMMSAFGAVSKYDDYNNNATHMGRVFSHAMSRIPYTTYGALSYILNLDNTDWPKRGDNAVNLARALFIDRPHYMDSDSYEVETGLFSQDHTKVINDSTTFGIISIDDDSYTISSDTELNRVIHYNNYSDVSIHPLKEYLNKKTNIHWSDSFSLSTDIKHIDLVGNSESVHASATINYTINIEQTFYLHIFTCQDTENLPNILGRSKHYISLPSTSLTLEVNTTSPALQFVKRWNTGYLYTNSLGDINEDRTAISPSCAANNLKDRLGTMVSWARGYNMSSLPAKAGSNKVAVKPDTPKYWQELIFSPMLIIDMDESNTTFLNKGDYKVVPAYYYGDCNNEGSVLTDYKNQRCNIDLDSAIYVDYDKSYLKSGDNKTPNVDIVSSFQKNNNSYSLLLDGSNPELYVQDLTVDLPSTITSGIYVLKFHKYFEHNGIELNPSKVKLLYTINSKSYTTDKDFIVIYISPEASGTSHTLKFNFGIKGIGHARIGNFAFYKVKIDESDNLNLILLNWWYLRAQEQAWGHSSNPIGIPQKDEDDFYKVLYDNIIFPSAICVYEDWSIFTGLNDEDIPGYTKRYKSMYLPQVIKEINGKYCNIGSVYSIIGCYNIQNTLITNIEGLPDDLTLEDKDNIICLNQYSRYA